MILSIIYLCFASGWPTQPLPFQRVVLTNDPFLVSCESMFVQDETLYFVENHSSQVFQSQILSSTRFKSSQFARKGEGPGEVYLPWHLAGDGTQVLVSGERGFSIFSKSGLYQSRFKIFTPLIDVSMVNGQIYCLTPHPVHDTLIEVYGVDGRPIQRFGKKYLDVKTANGSRLRQSRNEKHLYKGSLLSDGEHLFYFNNKFGNLFKYNLSGKLIDHKDARSFLAPRGRYLIDKNRDYLESPELMETGRTTVYRLFKDVKHFKGHFFLLRDKDYRWKNAIFASDEVWIWVLDQAMNHQATLKLSVPDQTTLVAMDLAMIQEQPYLIAASSGDEGIIFLTYHLDFLP